MKDVMSNRLPEVSGSLPVCAAQHLRLACRPGRQCVSTGVSERAGLYHAPHFVHNRNTYIYRESESFQTF